jgi:hypothetical protein
MDGASKKTWFFKRIWLISGPFLLELVPKLG